jgi:hypothetical protein
VNVFRIAPRPQLKEGLKFILTNQFRRKTKGDVGSKTT